MFNWIKRLFRDDFKRSQEAMNANLIAVARLSFIKPSTLLREALNTKANTEYLLEMIKEQDKIIESLQKEKIR